MNALMIADASHGGHQAFVPAQTLATAGRALPGPSHHATDAHHD